MEFQYKTCGFGFSPTIGRLSSKATISRGVPSYSRRWSRGLLSTAENIFLSFSLSKASPIYQGYVFKFQPGYIPIPMRRTDPALPLPRQIIEMRGATPHVTYSIIERKIRIGFWECQFPNHRHSALRVIRIQHNGMFWGVGDWISSWLQDWRGFAPSFCAARPFDGFRDVRVPPEAGCDSVVMCRNRDPFLIDYSDLDRCSRWASPPLTQWHWYTKPDWGIF